jgi:hypothetical protein
MERAREALTDHRVVFNEKYAHDVSVPRVSGGRGGLGGATELAFPNCPEWQ